MKKYEAELWSGIASAAVCAVVLIPAVIGGLGDDSSRLIPGWLWAVGSVGFLAAQLTTMVLWSNRPNPMRFLFGVQVLLGPALVLTSPATGWVQIILVFTAAMAAHVVSLRMTAFIVAGNTVVLVVVGWTNYGAGQLTADQTIEVMVGALIYLFLQAASVLSVYAMVRETSTRRELAVAHAELAAASAMLAESSRSEERLRISRELHDLIGHQLTVLTLELEVASHKAPPEVAENVGRARQVARDLLADVRVAVGELRRRAPRLRESIENIVTSLPHLEVHLSIDDDLVIDEEQATTFIRCVQEIVTNTIRHADATELWIRLTGDGDTLSLNAVDDGPTPNGFEIGNGLRGLNERVEKLGGTTRFWTDDGFHVRATVPAAALSHA